ncbi:MAG TPA: DNA polymerase III subunit epsilon [Thiomicrospira sp.]|jgi:DNA polymerase-3 subunit epsilon|nr:DNA polymerase III subunit epsilon [Thiomicrospira sp.]
MKSNAWVDNWSDEAKWRDFIFLDVETTGGKHQRDSITEIGLFHVRQGELVQTWQSFIQPRQSIPPWITRLTGISNSMVADAPKFKEVAEELVSLLEGKILVAHNARFDYSFLKSEFDRVGIKWRVTTLCTVKLSRALFKTEKRHGLDQIIERFDIQCNERHRAMDDAKVLWEFFQKLPKYHTFDTIWQAISVQLKQPSLPPNLSPDILQDCENLPGVYRFYGSTGQVLYVGKSIHLRSRILSHFNNDHRTSKALQMSSEIHDVDWTLCSGDLGAQLLEAKEIKRLSPKFNVKLRKVTKLWSLVKKVDNHNYETLEITSIEGLCAEQLDGLFGLFRSKKQAEKALDKLANEHKLCHRLTGLEKKKQGACFAHQVKKCQGACIGKETPAIYNLRLSMALMPFQQKVWPWSCPIMVKERGGGTKKAAIHVVHNWCWLGTVYSEEELHSLLENRQQEYVIDLDQYRILCQFLLKPSKNIQITPVHGFY